jgi:hypothetical protein
VNRRSERDVFDGLVAAVRAGESRVLVVRGDPGVGKTVLLDDLARRASDVGCRVARAGGVQSEMELAFAGLHQLCAPILDYAERLPVPQRDALWTAFGVAAGPAPDRFLVGLAVLSLMSEVAGERPLICVVDDAQWLDQASAQALGFAARRLAADPVGLAEFGTRVRFRHPLAHSAAYWSASVSDRQQVHAALAEVTDPAADPDRRAWHRAQAAAGPDEEVAAELERSAGRAQARGGLAATAAFLEQSVALTADPARRGERILAAAQASLHAGVFGKALDLLAMAEAGPLDEFQRARVDLLQAHVAFASGLGSDAPPLLPKAARRLEPFDLDLARETYLTAWRAAGMAGHLAGPGVLVEICHAAQALPPRQGDPRPLDLLLDGLALLGTEGHAAATPALQRAAEALADIPVEDVLRWGSVAAGAHALVWDVEGMSTISARQVQLARDAGAIALLPLYLSQLGIASTWMGDFAGSASIVADTDSVAAATGSRIAPFTLLRLRALQGREAEAAAAIEAAIEQAAAGGQGLAAAWAHWAAAVLYNGLARYEEAAWAARQATSDTLNPWMSMWALPELIEAAARRRHRARTRGAPTAGGDDAALPYRRRARHRGSLPGAAERRRGHRRAAPRGD